MADVQGSISIDLWKDAIFPSYYPPTVADTICGSSYKPSLSSSIVATRRVWNELTYINEGAVYWPGLIVPFSNTQTTQYNLIANIESVTSIKMVNLTLRFARMASAN